MNEQINEQLGLLEKELGRLKNVTDYIDDTKKNAKSVVTELQEVQKSYTSTTEKIFNIYKKAIEDLRKETELLIKEGVVQFEITGNQIDQTNREKLIETKKLLENYRKTVEATESLVKTLESIDFPSRLSKIEHDVSESYSKIAIRLDYQDKNSKNIKIILFVIVFLIIVGVAIGLVILK